jgi:signal peptidase II
MKPGPVVVFIVALIVFVADQVSKYLVVANVGLGNLLIPLAALGEWLRIVPGVNTGTACGYFPQAGIVFTLAPFFILAVVIVFYRSQRNPGWLLSIGTGLIIGGAFGNLVDRLRFGYVVDFIQIGRFPVFNVADACVSTAVVVLLIWSLREDSTRTTPVAQEGDTAAQTSNVPQKTSGNAWRFALAFLAVMAVIVVGGFILCVYVPSNFFR